MTTLNRPDRDERDEPRDADPDASASEAPSGESGSLSAEDDEQRVSRQLREHGVRLGTGGVAPRVFFPAIAVIVAVSVLAVAFPDGTGETLNGVQGWIVSKLGWFYILSVAFFLAIALYIGLGPYGRVVIGRDGDDPEFGLLSWFAMLFAAGMGIGLVFYGVAEPLSFATTQVKPGTGGTEAEQAQLAFAQTFVHWGVHPWSIYVVIGLSLGLAIHRRGRPVSIRWALEPLFGDRVRGPLGDAVDVLAIFGTVFGVATSLGLGVRQIAAGLSHLGVVDKADNTVLVILIACITFVATLSVVSGLGRGIKWLSNINIGLAGVLLLAVLAFGPTIFLLRNMVESMGVYLANVLQMTFDTSAYSGQAGQTWQSSWSIFYWGWWISWAPFVGVFIARISRGRTVRQFVMGSLLVPMLVAVVWFSVLGGTGVHRELMGAGGLVQDGAVTADQVLFETLDALTLGTVLSVMALVLVAIFFVTSSDSGSLVVDMLSSGGHPNPPTWSRVLWALMEGVIAITLLLAGGLTALRAGAIATALPFSAIMILMAFALLRALRVDLYELDRHDERRRRHEVREHLTRDFDDAFGDIVDGRVDDRIDYRLSATGRGKTLFRRSDS